jgi:cytochrome b6-f complex iron-sulfur subunit
MLKRRSFLAYFSIGWFTSCFPVILAAFDPSKATAEIIIDSDPLVTGNKDSIKPNTSKTTDGFTVVGSVAELEKNGHLQTKEVAVVINPSNPNQLIAVNPKCTHQGCDVKWSAGAKRYECPCHGANFDANGEVLNGPATKPLTAYPAKIVGTQVLVKISAIPPKDLKNTAPPSRGRSNP